MSISVGIDLGTTFSAVAYIDPKTKQPTIIPNGEGGRITPSVIQFLDGEMIFGSEAEEAMAAGESDCVATFKREMGSDDPYCYIDGVRMAAKLQETRSQNDNCPISAHICALNALGKKERRKSIINEFESYAEQGFPSIEDSEYIEKLVKVLLSSKLGEDEFDLVIGMLASSQPYVRVLSREVLGITTEKNNYAWNVLINVLSTGNDPAAIAVLSNECVVARKSEKQMNQLLDMLDSSKARAYFSEAVDDVQQKRESKAPRFGLGRLFGFGKKR